MLIYLVQHGKALDKAVDPDRSLSAQGKAELQTIAQQARSGGVKVSLIQHSGKLRAKQTAEFYASSLAVKTVRSIDGIQPKDNVIEFIKNHELKDHMMLVGHLPFMQKLAAYLVNGNEDHQVVRFQNGGIVCLEQDEAGHWYIKWTVLSAYT